MKIKFVGDANLHTDIIAGLVRRETLIEFTSADEAGLRGLSDDKVLLAAAGMRRVLVSHDHRTMPLHFASFLQKHQSSGVIIINQHISVGRAINGLNIAWNLYETEDWINRIVYLNQLIRI